MYIPRNIEKKILNFIKSPEIIAIVGPRQSGKTTLLSHIHSRYTKTSSYVTFEDPDILSMFENSTDDFIKMYVEDKNFLFVDEFQYAKRGGKILKQIYDTQKIKIIITGSSSIDLTIKALKYLTGRIFVFELFPFDFEEFLRAKNTSLWTFYTKHISKKKSFSIINSSHLPFDAEIKKKINKYFEEFILFGGYPRVVLSKNKEEKIEVLKGIYSTFFLREVKDYLGLIEDYKLQRLIKATALQIGNLIDYNELGITSGYSFISLKKYLNFLEKSYILSLIKPFFSNRRKEIIKNPKVYFIDTGLRNYISGDFRPLNSRTDSSFLLENAVFSAIKKKNIKVSYWRTKTKQEIDFIIEENKMAIEVKNRIDKCKVNISTKDFSGIYPDYRLWFCYYEGFDNKVKREKAVRIPAFCI